MQTDFATNNRRNELELAIDWNHPRSVQRNRWKRIFMVLAVAVGAVFTGREVAAAEAPVPLGSAANFAVLAGSTVTSTGLTVVTGDLGAGPGTAVTGFPPGIVNGMIHEGDPAAAQAQADLLIAYNNAAGRNTAPITVAGNIGGQTLAPGLYKSTSSLAISSGDLTLDAQGNPNAVFIFQMQSTLTTTSGRKVILSGGAQAENVFWQVGSSATLGTTTIFKGTILAQVSITIQTGARLHGRALARSGAVTLEANSVTLPTLPEPPTFGPISRSGSGAVTLIITNTPGLILTLEHTTNFTKWILLATPTFVVTPDTFVDNTASGEPRRFYRASHPR